MNKELREQAVAILVANGVETKIDEDGNRVPSIRYWRFLGETEEEYYTRIIAEHKSKL